MKAAIKQLTFVFGLGVILWTAESSAARLNVYEYKGGIAIPAVNLDQAKAAETLSKSVESMLLAAKDNEERRCRGLTGKERRCCLSPRRRECRSPH